MSVNIIVSPDITSYQHFAQEVYVVIYLCNEGELF